MKKRIISWFMILMLLTAVVGIPCFASEQDEALSNHSDMAGESEDEGGVDDSGGESGGSGESTGGESGGSGEGTGGEGGGSSEGTGGEGGGSGESTGGESGGSSEGTGGEGSGSSEGTGGEGGSSEGTGGEGGGSSEGTGGESGGSSEDTGSEDNTDSGDESANSSQYEETTAQRNNSGCQHNFPNWEQRSWAHIRTCTKCEAFQSEPHTYSQKYIEDTKGKGHWLVCDVCDYKNQVSDHTFGDVWNSDETGHWKECTLCKATAGVEAHIPGAGANESRDQLCTVCEYILSPKTVDIPETTAATETSATEAAPEEVTVPENTDAWESDDQMHWKVDKNGVKVKRSMHKWDEGAAKPDGSTAYTCTVCQAEWIDDGSSGTTNSSMQRMQVAVIAAVILILAVVLLVLLIKIKNPGRYSSTRRRR